MITIAGGILLALAILAIGFLMVMLFVSGLLIEIAWTLTKWLFRLILLLSPIPIFILAQQSGSSTLKDIGSLAVLGALIYLDSLKN